MYSRISNILLLISFLLLLAQPVPASIPQPGSETAKQALLSLQDHFSASNPLQEKRNEYGSAQKIEELFRFVSPETSGTVCRIRPLITNDVPDFPSLLVYTQTTSTYL